MRLSEIVSHADLSWYPKIALVIFTAVFVMVTWRVLRRPKHEMNRIARLPLEDGGTSASTKDDHS